MINFFKYVCLSLLIIFVYSCREPFDYNQPDSNKNTLVVEGVITDSPGPYMIKLSQTVPFSSDKQVAVKKAIVYVMDDSNNRYDFKEKNSGQYYSDSASFRGEIGRNYTLYIKTNDGLEYKSSPCLIEPVSKIDSIYGNNSAYLPDFYLYADISFGPEQRMSTKLETSLAIENIISELHYIYGPEYTYAYNEDSTENIKTLVPGKGEIIGLYQIIKTFYTIKTLNFAPVLRTNTDYVAGSKIKKIPLGYIQVLMYTDTIDSLTTLTYGNNYILITYASTVSNETFNYYYNLSTQISGRNTFFDPIPVNLIGNIKCTNNSTKDAFGLFQANSVVKKYNNINRSEDWYNIQPINGIPPAKIDSITFY